LLAVVLTIAAASASLLAGGETIAAGDDPAEASKRILRSPFQRRLTMRFMRIQRHVSA
jgi:hypothetical protein